MKLSAIYKFQLAEHKKSIIVFYLVIIAILAVVFTINIVSVLIPNQSNFSIQLSGIDLAPTIFLFVCGLNAFKENFQMSLQNGISRKSLFVNRIAVDLTLAVGMSLLNQIILFIGKSMALFSATIQYSSLLEELYGLRYAGHPNGLMLYLEIFLFYIFLFAAFLSIGYFITVAFYRMNKKQKIAYIVGFYILAFVAFPLIDELLYKLGIFSVLISEVLLRFLYAIMGVSAQNPYIAMISLLIISIIMRSLTWLLVRKTGIKN
ncbi:hypothetical protein GH810_01140 [Acetobacterium paludosum]|uniref:Uncharacterized protein n=1 Tax=Acetobacterium paludosum TaxID=52693 RepID=A0A923HQG3_9FIRM|nr:hypothetical protein [Acetobacterium paludosum]MBC3886919.1 hypothetical protein [Acetobacterium paludosum]